MLNVTPQNFTLVFTPINSKCDRLNVIKDLKLCDKKDKLSKKIV